MLHVTDQSQSRRSFLTVGGLGLGGWTLEQMLAAKAMAGLPRSVVKDRSVVFLFMHGGPSQTETFDPKMTAPSGVASATGEIRTTVPGITYGATFRRLARLAHKTAIVRSFQTGNGNHDIKPIVTGATLGANIGSLFARVAGANHPTTGMPRNVALFPRAVDDQAMPAVKQFGNFTATGSLGAGYAPFVPGAGGNLQRDMQLKLEPKRLGDRRSLLANLDQLKRQLEQSHAAGGLDRFQTQAFDTILGGVAKAFDLSNEDPRTVARFDTSKLVRREDISQAWNNHKRYADHISSLGKLMLMARRLCEAGCGFVTVTTNFVWDMHADRNNATIDEGMRYVGLPFDHAVSAFIEDVEARGLRDKILLVACGEMGRTPRINARGGRDHWGRLAPLLVYGGDSAPGAVIGQSTRDVGEPLTEPMTNQHLLATVMHSLLDISELRLRTDIPADLMRAITATDPIPGLVG